MKLDFRDCVFEAAHTAMAEDRRTVMLTNDMGAMGLDRIRGDFPERVFNVGISEQNMISVAAGLALSGRPVFAYGIIAHVFARAFEQLRNDVCCLDLPVVVLGVGSGLAYGADGPTHHAVQDIAALRTLPNMAVYNPADGVAAGALVRDAFRRGRPALVRMDKEQSEPVYADGHDFSPGFHTLSPGAPDGTADIVLAATGVMVHRALDAARRLTQAGLVVRVVDVYRLKPVDDAALAAALTGARMVAAWEENTPIGGLGSLIAELMTRRAIRARFFGFSLGDEPLLGTAGRGWAERRFGIDVDTVTAVLREAAAESAGAPTP